MRLDRTRLDRAVVRAAVRLPRRVRRRLFGEPPKNDRGVPLAEDVHALLSLERRMGSRIAKGEVEAARAGLRQSIRVVEGRERWLWEVGDEVIAGVPCRRYRPGPKPRPRLVYLHGGGWVVGDLRSHDRICRRLASEADVELVSVDYRLAPEHPYPHGLNDVIAVLEAVLAEGEGPVAVGGDSAGGNLALASCIALRDRGQALPARMLLVYPGTDYAGTMPSRDTFAKGFLLEKEDIDWYHAHYAAPDARDPLVSPMYAEAAGLPPAILCVAGFDPLRDEGECMGANLRAAGVELVEVPAEDQVHGFFNMDGVLPSADAAVGRVVDALRAWRESA